MMGASMAFNSFGMHCRVIVGDLNATFSKELHKGRGTEDTLSICRDIFDAMAICCVLGINVVDDTVGYMEMVLGFAAIDIIGA